MCGLCGGISSYLADFEMQTFQHLAIVSTFRGKFGAGIVLVPQDARKDTIIHHSENTLAELVTSGEFYKDTVGKKKKYAVAMAHARLPTAGGFNLNFVHPFTVGHIIGMHNGTFKKVRGEIIKTGESDSHAFFTDVAEHGIELAVKKAEGAYSLVWVDTRANTLNFLRNAERPMFFGHYDEDLSTIYWASEPEMLHFVLSREKWDEKCTVNIRILPEDRLVSFKLRHSHGDLVKPISNRVVKHYDTSVPVVVPPLSSNAVVPFEQCVQEALQHPRFPGVPQNVSSTVPYHKLRVIPEPPSYLKDDFNGAPLWTTKPHCWMPATMVEDILRKGCAGCGNPATVHEYWTKDELTWFKPKEFLCSQCWNFNDIARGVAQLEMGQGEGK